jgi:prepilin-type N-terminal cleavage/methylation domain-containing protein/prepilin-type processing-associated H-X9-DG protein
MRQDIDRCGFSLVELLVVIAIIGMLVSLLLPAVQSAREAARSVACGNQLRQLNIALHNYHSARGSLPAGVCNNNAGASLPPTLYDLRTPDTWFAAALPFMEHQSIYDRFAFSEGSGSPVNAPLVATALPGVMCPSDAETGTPICTSRCNLFAPQTASKMLGLWYAASLGNGPLWNQCSFCSPAFPTSTNEACCSGLDRGIDGNPNGMFAVAKIPVRFSQVTDGQSKTIILGETLPRESMHIGAYTGHFPVTATNIPINSFIPREDWPALGHLTNYGEAGGIKSRHPSGAYVAFADGSVSFTNDSIDFEVLLALGSKASGNVETTP